MKANIYSNPDGVASRASSKRLISDNSVYSKRIAQCVRKNVGVFRGRSIDKNLELRTKKVLAALEGSSVASAPTGESAWFVKETKDNKPHSISVDFDGEVYTYVRDVSQDVVYPYGFQDEDGNIFYTYASTLEVGDIFYDYCLSIGSRWGTVNSVENSTFIGIDGEEHTFYRDGDSDPWHYYAWKSPLSISHNPAYTDTDDIQQLSGGAAYTDYTEYGSEGTIVSVS